MQKLHLVGFTTDQDGLILSARRNARSGGYLLQVDGTLADAVEAYRTRQEAAGATGTGRADRVESRLPVSEIQLRLRRGKSLKDVAKEAGVDPEWVERFAAPVVAEQNQVIEHVRSSALRRPRLGASALRIGDALRRNLAERGVVMSPAEFTSAWSTRQMPDGRWTVRFKVHYRGSDRTLRFDLAHMGGEIVAYDQLTRQLAYITPPPRKVSVDRPKPAVDEDPSVPKRAVVSTGFRPEPDRVRPVSRPAKEREKAAKAMNKAAIKRASEAEKAAARKARERDQLLARKAREAVAEAARREKEAAARARAAAAASRAAAAEVARQERADREAAAARQAERDRAREAARAKAIKAVKARPSATKAATRKAAAPSPVVRAAAKKTTAADQARTAAAVRKRGAAAEAAVRTRATKARTASATTTAKRAAAKVAPPPAKALKRASVAPRTTAAPVTAAGAAPAKAAPAKAAPAKAAPAVKPAPAKPAPAKRAAAPIAEPKPLPSARVDPAHLVGAAVESYGPEATRALFRAGLVEPAASDGHTPAATPDRLATNGTPRSSVRPMGRRRRRQLRAD